MQLSRVSSCLPWDPPYSHHTQYLPNAIDRTTTMQTRPGPTSAWTKRASSTTISPAPSRNSDIHMRQRDRTFREWRRSPSRFDQQPTETTIPTDANAPTINLTTNPIFPKTSAPQLRPAKPTPPLSYIRSGDHRATDCDSTKSLPARQHSPPPPSAKHTTLPPINATRRPSSARDLPQLVVSTRHPHHHSYRDLRPRCKIPLRTTAATTPASLRLPASDTHHLHAETSTSTTK